MRRTTAPIVVARWSRTTFVLPACRAILLGVLLLLTGVSAESLAGTAAPPGGGNQQTGSPTGPRKGSGGTSNAPTGRGRQLVLQVRGRS